MIRGRARELILIFCDCGGIAAREHTWQNKEKRRVKKRKKKSLVFSGGHIHMFMYIRDYCVLV